jgi:hypothetical protein
MTRNRLSVLGAFGSSPHDPLSVRAVSENSTTGVAITDAVDALEQLVDLGLVEYADPTQTMFALNRDCDAAVCLAEAAAALDS